MITTSGNGLSSHHLCLSASHMSVVKISILTPDLSKNCLGRAHLLAQLLERNYEVEIIGPIQGDGIWEPVKDDYDYLGVETTPFFNDFIPNMSDLLDLVSGDIVYASKPRFESYFVGLLKSISSEIPMILDIDDWESGFTYDDGGFSTYFWEVPKLTTTQSFYYTRFLEAISDVADARTVSNQFLQEEFGGELIPHARDTSKFDPDKYDSRTVKADLGLPVDGNIIMFSGTPRPHKGVWDMIQAVDSLNRNDVYCVVVGADNSEFVDQLECLEISSLIIKGQQPFEMIPKWIAASDIIAIPQRDTPMGRGQLPAKVFDAMAMAKPIVATRVSDLPNILSGCGYLVDSGSPSQLRTSFRELLEDESYRNELGDLAREKCKERYSHDVLAPRLHNLIQKEI